MKDYLPIILFLGFAFFTEAFTTEQSIRCVEKGGVWVNAPGCDPDYCEAKPDAEIEIREPRPAASGVPL